MIKKYITGFLASLLILLPTLSQSGGTTAVAPERLFYSYMNNSLWDSGDISAGNHPIPGAFLTNIPNGATLTIERLTVRFRVDGPWVPNPIHVSPSQWQVPMTAFVNIWTSDGKRRTTILHDNWNWHRGLGSNIYINSETHPTAPNKVVNFVFVWEGNVWLNFPQIQISSRGNTELDFYYDGGAGITFRPILTKIR